MKPPLLKAALLASISVLSACSTLTPPKEQPVIEDKIGEAYGTLAVTAERRIIIFGRTKADGNNASAQDKNPVVCAEPSPDVAESLVTSIKALAEASAKKGGTDEAKISAEFTRSLTTAISSVFTRSQGIQFFRDTSYALCQAHINGTIDKPTYASSLMKLVEVSRGLIDKEIPSLDAKRAESAAQRAEAARDEAAKQVAIAKQEASKSAESAQKAAASADLAKASATKAEEAKK